MALSGSVSSSKYNGVRYIKLSWTATQNIANNTSTISWTLRGAGSSPKSYYRAGGFKVVIDGTTVYSKSTDYRIDLYGDDYGSAVASGTHTIKHNDDGTKSFSISIQAGIYYYAVNCTGSGTFTLNQIPRAASLTAAPDFNDENNPTISYSNPAGNAVTALDACISFDGSADNVAYRAVSKTGSSYTFSLTEAERNVLRNGTGGGSRTVKFYLRTTIGSNVYYSTLTRTLSLVNHTPTLSPNAYVATNSTTYSLTGSQTTFIKGYSDVTVTTGAAARKGASVSKQSITNNGKTINAASGTFSAVTNGTFNFSVTDSRGFTTTQTLTRSIINYINPTCNLKAKMDIHGLVTLTGSGNYFNASFGAVHNQATIQYRFKRNDVTNWSSWMSPNVSYSGNTYVATTTVQASSYLDKIEVQMRISDKLKTATSPVVTVTALPVFDWGENSFNFNVPVNFAAGYTQTASAIDDTPIESDFIVEQGTSGIWSYRKWNSGMAECWGRKTVNVAVNTAWGSLYVSGYLYDSMVDLPFTFKEIPMINANLSANGAGGFLIASGSVPATTTSTGGYEIARGTAGAANNYVINYDVRGRWK